MRALNSVLMIFTILSSLVITNIKAADELAPNDFSAQYWSKTIDLFDYAREHPDEVPGPVPPGDWSSEIVLNYINKTDVKFLYAGFSGLNINKAKVVVPLQSFIERFKTREGHEAITASTFLMLMAFNDTGASLYPGSPDEGDNLWASFSVGGDWSKYFEGREPRLASSVEVTPLKQSSDGSEWTWGMKYRNLAAIWWRLTSDKGSSGFDPMPVSFAVYDELSFSYRLVFDGANGATRLYLTYTIGEMRDIWVFQRAGFLPYLIHYNDTGCFLYDRQKLSSDTIHDFVKKNNIKMSIVSMQRSYVADLNTVNKVGNVDVSKGSVDVSKASVITTTDLGEKVYQVDFGPKVAYKLYGSSGGSSTQHDSITRTVEVEEYARNPVIEIQTSLLRYMNVLALKMFPVKYSQAMKTFMNATQTDYLYISSYPVYDGSKVVHDPVYVAFIPQTQQAGSGSIPIPTVLVVTFGLGLVVVLLLIKRGVKPYI